MAGCVYIVEMSARPKRNASTRSLEYAKLRELYDTAFHEWIEERRRHVLIAGNPDQDTEPEGNARIAAASLAVRERRDTMADFMMPPHQANLLYAHLQDAAYFIWLAAGCPNGTSTSDWYSAQRQLSEDV
jgi:hypothetical protein